jgi:hypothetical protein
VKMDLIDCGGEMEMIACLKLLELERCMEKGEMMF